MELSDLIKGRRSIRQFKPGPVDPAMVETLLETAIYAPNHRFTQPWRFIYLAGQARDGYAELRAKDAEARGKDGANARQTILAVPAILVAVCRRSPADPTLDLEDFAATCCAVQNFLLLAQEQGLGTAWKTFPDSAELREFLSLKDAEQESVIGVIYLGYPAEVPAMRERQPARELLSHL
jgi:nitroreductase